MTFKRSASAMARQGRSWYQRLVCWGARLCALSAMALSTCGGSAIAQLDFESEPINYNTATPSNRVQRLQDGIERGETQLEYDEAHGYLKAVLEQLDVPIESQVLVFSKTSLQLHKITPKRPRALYFNDDVYVGWVQRGDVVEVSSVDPDLGAVFYTVQQKQNKPARFVRDRGQCIVCHASSRTLGVPGHLVRSVYPSRSGQPFFGSGTFTIDHRSAFKKRWGGWYVTGTHGSLRHMGNVFVEDPDQPEVLNVEAGANQTDLSPRVNTKPYLSEHSDIVALMVLEHQTRMHNLIARASFETRRAMYHDAVMNETLQRPADHWSESALRRVDNAAEELVEYMLFADEIELTETIRGTSGFAAKFSSRGPKDDQGRSLRDLELNTRIMKYPCSYVIYSEAFDRLPDAVKSRVYRRLFDALSAQSPTEGFAHLTADDRTDILEILKQTKPNLPDYWYRT